MTMRMRRLSEAAQSARKVADVHERMTVVIAGSSRLPKGQAPRLLVRFLAALPDDALVVLRKGAHTPMASFEEDVALLCAILHLDWKYVSPKPTPENPGRASVFSRDIEMIEESDLVCLFMTPEDALRSIGGTPHLMEVALNADRPVYAYSVDLDGNVERIGEYDPENRYGHLALST